MKAIRIRKRITNQMAMLLAALFFIFSLPACDTNNNDSITEAPITIEPEPELEVESTLMEWSNLVRVGDTYTFTPTIKTLDEIITFGQIGATSNEVCLVIWETATSAWGACRNLVEDGQWPIADIPVSTIAYFLMSLGTAGTRTVEETELIDIIRNQTRCTAPRQDGSRSPCTLL